MLEDTFGFVRLTWLLLISAVILSGCGSTPVNPPAELQDFDPAIDVSKLWSTGVGDGDDGRNLELQLVSDADYLYSIDAEDLITKLSKEDGDEVWERDYEERVIGGLGGDRDFLFYTTFQGELICVEKETGNSRWRRKLNREVVAPPSSDGRTVVVQSISGSLIAYDVSEGNQLWRYDSDGPSLSLRGTSQVVIDQGQVINGFSNGDLMAFDARTGQPMWRQALGEAKGRTELERLVDIDGTPQIDGDRVYGVAYQGKVAAIDRRTGAEVWSKPASSYRSISLGSGKVLVSLEDGVIVALNQGNGNELWRNEDFLFRRLGAPLIAAGRVFVTDFEGYVHVLGHSDGQIRARFKPDSDGLMGNMQAEGNTLYVYTRDGKVMVYRFSDQQDSQP